LISNNRTPDGKPSGILNNFDHLPWQYCMKNCKMSVFLRQIHVFTIHTNTHLLSRNIRCCRLDIFPP
jgi:hypothetical protein